MAAIRARRLSSDTDHRPGRMRPMRALERLGDGLGVVVPLGEPLDVDRSSASTASADRFARSRKRLQLLGPADVQPELDQQDAILDQHPLEIGHLAEEMLALASVQKPKTFSTTPRLYQERSKNTISPAAGRCVDVALEIPLRSLRGSVGLDSATTRAMRGFRFSRKRLIVPPLPAASRPSNTMTMRLPVSRNVRLQLHQFDLQRLHVLFVLVLVAAFSS